MPILWRPQMSVHNSFVDADHRYLFCLINTVELTLRTHQNLDLIETALDQLLEYTKLHFAREEKLQLKIKYARYVDHKLEHQQIIEKLEEIRTRLLHVAVPVAAAAPAAGSGDATTADVDVVPDGPVSAQDTEALIALLRHWILDHVLKTDMQMKDALAQYPENYA